MYIISITFLFRKWDKMSEERFFVFQNRIIKRYAKKCALQNRDEKILKFIAKYGATLRKTYCVLKENELCA